MKDTCAYGRPSDGHFFLNMNGSGGTMVATTSITDLAVGSQYRVLFDISTQWLLRPKRHSIGRGEYHHAGKSEHQGGLFAERASGMGSLQSQVNYVEKSIDFTATGILQTLTFDRYARPDGCVVDNFRVTTIPEPASLVLLATALVGLLAYAWRKRK